MLGCFSLTLYRPKLSVPPHLHLTQPLLHKPRLSLAVAFRQSVDRSVVTGLGSEHSDREEVEVTGMWSQKGGMKEKIDNSGRKDSGITSCLADIIDCIMGSSVKVLFPL